MSEQRMIDTMLEKYRESHVHPVNEMIHIVCVPVIVLSLLALLWTVHPLLCAGLVIAALVYYFRLSPPFALGMLAMSSAMLAVLYVLPGNLMLPLPLALGLFVLAWIGQFIGHLIEGRKPPFLDDLGFLLIGPRFVLSILYRRLALRC